MIQFMILIIAGDVSDSGQGSELCLEDTQCLAYHFYVQDYLCGKYRTALSDQSSFFPLTNDLSNAI